MRLPRLRGIRGFFSFEARIVFKKIFDIQTAMSRSANNLTVNACCLVLLLPVFSVNAQDGGTRNFDDEYERIATEEDFVKRIVGRALEYDTGAVIIFLEDRTFGGGYSGSRVWGEWVWREDRLCHQMNIGEKRYKVACKIPEIMKKRIRFIREDGSFYGLAKIR